MTTTTTVPNLGTAQSANPLKALLAFGQSPWMDYIRRDLLTSGGLKKYIEDDGLRGMTSNPAIFEKAITGSSVYSDILEFARRKETGRQRPLRENRYTRRSGRLRHFQIRLCRVQAPRRLRQPRSLSLSRQRHQGHDRRSPPPLEVRQSPECHDQGSCHSRRHSCDPPTPRRWPEHQYHAAFRAVRVRASRGSFPSRSRSSRRQRPGHRPDRERRQLFREPHRFSRSMEKSMRSLRPRLTPRKRHCSKASTGKSPSPTPSSRTKNIRSFLAARGGRPWPPKVRKRSACSGPAPARRIPNIATSSTWKN